MESTTYQYLCNNAARGYCVSTVGLDEAVIREYIRNQEDEEKRQEQLNLRGL